MQNETSVGKMYQVLVEGNSKKPDQLMGRNRGNKILVFPDNGSKPGDLIRVRVTEATTNTLIAEHT
jgi:tRNA-2-methylthio-N6-dimethylallyladenosine synthase